MGTISTLGVLRLRALSAVSRDKSMRRSAQDDGFVGGLKYSWLDMQKTRKDRKSHRLSDDVSVVSWRCKNQRLLGFLLSAKQISAYGAQPLPTLLLQGQRRQRPR